MLESALLGTVLLVVVCAVVIPLGALWLLASLTRRWNWPPDA